MRVKGGGGVGYFPICLALRGLWLRRVKQASTRRLSPESWVSTCCSRRQADRRTDGQTAGLQPESGDARGKRTRERCQGH